MRVGPKPLEEKRQNNRGKRSRYERYTDELGRSKEKMAMVALSKGPLPAWIKSYRRANHQEDLQGKDIVVMTDLGEVYLQIKSSAEGCNQFMEEHPKGEIVAIMIKATDDLDFVRNNLVWAAERLRRKLMRQRGIRRSA